ncbi:imm11 family protein [Rhizobium sp. LjRoot254]|uniref:imm11 family protein n=1 Tax=Rhizobium sp. LjRoot254 TaxID=3342297 RepID=UPI003ECEAF89
MTTDHIWLLKDDGELMNLKGILILESSSNSDLSAISFWNRSVAMPCDSGQISFKLHKGRIRSLLNYDIYPSTSATPLVSDRMKTAIEQIFGSTDVAFYATSISDRSGDLLPCWIMYPLSKSWCVDRKKTRAKWSIPDLKPEEISLVYTNALHLRPECLGDRHITRMRDHSPQIVVSSEFKQAVESVNRRGIRFILAEGAELGWKPRDWDEIPPEQSN